MTGSAPPIHLCAGNNVELQFLVHQAGAGLGQVALVEDQAVSPEAARAAQLLQPLGPLGVQLPVGLLVLGLEDADDFLETEGGSWVSAGEGCGTAGTNPPPVRPLSPYRLLTNPTRERRGDSAAAGNRLQASQEGSPTWLVPACAPPLPPGGPWLRLGLAAREFEPLPS